MQPSYPAWSPWPSFHNLLPVARTPVFMNCLIKYYQVMWKHIIQRLLLLLLHSHPTCFAYRNNRFTEDATATVLHPTLTHLEQRTIMPGFFPLTSAQHLTQQFQFQTEKQHISQCCCNNKVIIYTCNVPYCVINILQLLNNCAIIIFQLQCNQKRALYLLLNIHFLLIYYLCTSLFCTDMTIKGHTLSNDDDEVSNDIYKDNILSSQEQLLKCLLDWLKLVMYLKLFNLD